MDEFRKELTNLKKDEEQFNCSVDELLRGNIDFSNEAYSDIKIIAAEDS